MDPTNENDALSETQELSMPGTDVVERLTEPPKHVLQRHVPRLQHLELSLKVAEDAKEESMGEGTAKAEVRFTSQERKNVR